MRARRAIVAGLASAALVAGCGDDDVTTVADQPGSTTSTTATAEPGAGSGAVGDGEGGVALDRVGDFDQPVYVTQAPSGDPDHLYVVEQCGRIQRVPIAGGEPSVFLDLGDLVTCGGEQGLLSVAFDPEYADSGAFYVNYTDSEGDSRTVDYRRSAGDPAMADPESAARAAEDRRLRPQPQRWPAALRPGRTTFTSAWATAAAPATRSARRRIRSSRSASCCDSIPPGPGSSSSRRSGCATRGDTPSTAARATSGSET